LESVTPARSPARRLALAAGALALLAACGAEQTTEGPVTGDGGRGGALTSSSSTTATTTASEGGSGGGDAGLGTLGPPYPIVLAHGFFGFEDFAGVDFIDYYYGVRDYLGSVGEAEVYTPLVDPFNSSEYRAAQLTDRIEQILRETGHRKVNVIAHSQAGLDARIVAHEHPEWIASIVTVATPHRGSEIADIGLKLVDHPAVDAVLDFFFQTVGVEVWDNIGQETSLAASLHSFATGAMDEFNATYTDQPGVSYWSIAARTDGHDGGAECSAPMPPFIEQWIGETDPVDLMFTVTEEILDGGFGDPIPNDGLVTVASARWGKFLGCVPADHIDEIGQVLGDSPGWFNDWDYLRFYADVVAMLRGEGL
jgi:triacylglycerol lipase